MVLLFSILIIYEVILFSITLASGRNIYAIARRMTTPIMLKKKNDIIDKPDIYYIVFDSYANSSSLKQFWGYNNDIIPFLESKNFFIVDSAFSNYASTPFSISSVLNLQYLKGAEPYLLSTSSNFLIGRQAYLNNIFFEFLKKEGYKFSIFSQLESEESVTKFGVLGVEKPVNWLRKLTMERIYLNPWILAKINRLLFNDPNKQPALITQSMADFREYNNEAINHILKECGTVEQRRVNNPIFGFTHIMLPHDPYQLDEKGRLISGAIPGGEDMNGYLGQVKYSNILIKKITECLLRDTTRKKIIIFQGDHGYRHYNNAPAKEQFNALNAIYFYNQDYKGLSKKTSHVNTFRIVVNKFFETQLPLLKDSVVFKSKRD